MRTIVVLGNDKIANSVKELAVLNKPDILVVTDKSTSIKRVLKLVYKGKLKFSLLLKMFLSELRRPAPKLTRSVNEISIKNNKELIIYIEDFKPERVVLFRAGLIINRKVIALGVPLMNIHCAKIPEYGGIGSIQKALDEKAFSQEATLHQVTTTIDSGIVYDTQPYQLDPRKSYYANENIAYKAGIDLLLRTLSRQEKVSSVRTAV